jgi:hypothetical protein
MRLSASGAMAMRDGPDRSIDFICNAPAKAAASEHNHYPSVRERRGIEMRAHDTAEPTHSWASASLAAIRMHPASQAAHLPAATKHLSRDGWLRNHTRFLALGTGDI